ncbi:hypothetical protein, partial [Pseudoalteromonas nigrifaciens]|uniref:hypothetical protein n=1 Tax=Pseudoalteromonas nigrifaciens TaxID=28109 RepID=UPI001D005661
SEFIIEQVFLDNQNIDARCGSLDAYVSFHSSQPTPILFMANHQTQKSRCITATAFIILINFHSTVEIFSMIRVVIDWVNTAF